MRSKSRLIISIAGRPTGESRLVYMAGGCDHHDPIVRCRRRENAMASVRARSPDGTAGPPIAFQGQ